MIDVVNPADSSVIDQIASDDIATISAKFNLLLSGKRSWQTTPLKDKIASIENFAQKLLANIDQLSDILSAEVGKPIRQARDEIKATAGRISFFSEQVPHMLAERNVSTDGATVSEYLRQEPLGIVANISAWNYPYFVGTNVYIPALLTGNCVLYKPSEYALLSARAVANILYDSGIPQDAFQVIYGNGVAGEELLQQPVDGIFFTGSKGTGLKIAQQLKHRLVPLQLELGGKDPAYVAEDADLAMAAIGLADGAFYNAGQSCCSIERIYVHHRNYDQFVKLMVEHAQKIKVGKPQDPSTDMGPLTRKSQLAFLESQVGDAREKGADILCGGERLPGPGYYFGPTVISNANHGMTCMRDESFGPIVGIQSVQDDAEALQLMNDTEYGLSASIFTKSRERAENMMSLIEAGTVYVNCCDRVSAHLPWSGRKNSGIGSTMGLAGISAFLKPKSWHVKGF